MALSTLERARLTGQKIRAARKRTGMSQLQLATKLAELDGRDPESVRRSLINNETGKYSPRLDTLHAIAAILDTPLEFFRLDGEVDGHSPPFHTNGRPDAGQLSAASHPTDIGGGAE